MGAIWTVRSLSRSPNFSTENPTFLPLGNLLKLPFGAPFGSKSANCCVYELRKNGGCNRHLNHCAALVFLVRMSKSSLGELCSIYRTKVGQKRGVPPSGFKEIRVRNRWGQ